MPAGVDPDALVELLIQRTSAADPDLVKAIGIAGARRATKLPRLVTRSARPQRMVVVAASERALVPLAEAAHRSGWRVATASPETRDPLALTGLLLGQSVDTILVGAGEPPGADERRALDEVVALVAAVAARRPEITIVLAGSMAKHLPRFEAESGERQGEILLAPAGAAGDVPGGPLRELLDDLRAPVDDSRRAMVNAAAALADALDRRVELVDIGLDGGLRATAAPGVAGAPSQVEWSFVAAAALVPPDPDDAAVDRVLAWSTAPLDRHRMRDRLRELRLRPWADAAGEGARLRLAAARAALGVLVDATPAQSAEPAPDLIVAAGGAWAVAPGPVVALAIADVVRRPGAVAIGLDHARLLGPLGSIPEAVERRQVLADLADDLLAPLGSVVVPGGIRPGRSAGRVVVHGGASSSELELIPGGLELIDLPPGEVATAELHFRDTVRLGGRGRQFALEVSGGLGGLLIDLRDVPLRLPDRVDRRRELLEAWQDSLWVTRDR